uniref:Dopamine receptor D4 n=1 Tax=Bursaphelenchus xylophilus TaxID=6326 RepID=A0A1I7SHK9_BURXY
GRPGPGRPGPPTTPGRDRESILAFCHKL